MTDAATLASAERVAAAQPEWLGIARLGKLINLPPTTLLHAGPPYRDLSAIPKPVRNAAAAALVFEGVAPSYEDALRMIAGGTVTLKPAQDHGVVTPLAAVASRSMWVSIVQDRTTGIQRFSQINEGTGIDAQRFGSESHGMADRLRAIHGQAGRALNDLFGDPVPLLPIALECLENGDELHGRVGVGSALLTAICTERLGAKHPATRYLAGTPHFFLNVWMAAVAAMLAAGEGVEGSALITRAGGNGVEFGIALASDPKSWKAAPADAPGAPDPEGGHLPAIGDSAVIDAFGLGALALDAAPILAEEFGVTAPDPQITSLCARHPILNRPVGLDARRIQTLIAQGNLPPPACLAILDAAGTRGLIGRGIARHPAGCYAELDVTTGEKV